MFNNTEHTVCKLIKECLYVFNLQQVYPGRGQRVIVNVNRYRDSERERKRICTPRCVNTQDTKIDNMYIRLCDNTYQSQQLLQNHSSYYDIKTERARSLNNSEDLSLVELY